MKRYLIPLALLAFAALIISPLGQTMRTVNDTNEMVMLNPQTINTNLFVHVMPPLKGSVWTFIAGDTTGPDTNHLDSVLYPGLGRWVWNNIGTNYFETLIVSNLVAGGDSLWTNLGGILQPQNLTLPVMITNQLQFGPGTTNVLFAIPAQNLLMFTNGSTANTGIGIGVEDGNGHIVKLLANGTVGEVVGAGNVQAIDLVDNSNMRVRWYNKNLTPAQPQSSIGAYSSSNPNNSWSNLWLHGTAVAEVASLVGTTNYSRVAIYQPDTNTPVIIDHQTFGTAGYSRGFSFRTNGVEVFNVTGTGGPSSGANWTTVGTANPATDSALAGTALIQSNPAMTVSEVDTNGVFVDSVLGNDSGPGTYSNPFRTLTKVTAVADTNTARIRLKAGSHFRSELILTASNQTVEPYGSGPAPIIDGADDILTNAWSKTVGRTYVYEFSGSVTVTEAGASRITVFENGLPMQRTNSVADCDTYPGTFYSSTMDPVGDGYESGSYTTLTPTIYVHPSDNSNPVVNNYSYAYSRRTYCIESFTATSPTIKGITTMRQLNNDGSTRIGVGGSATDCSFLHGTKHNVYARRNVNMTNCIAYGGYYSPGAGSVLFVANDTYTVPLADTNNFVGCTAIKRWCDTVQAGFLQHGANTLLSMTFDGCKSIGTGLGIEVQNCDLMVVTNCLIAHDGTGYGGGSYGIAVWVTNAVIADTVITTTLATDRPIDCQLCPVNLTLIRDTIRTPMLAGASAIYASFATASTFNIRESTIEAYDGGISCTGPANLTSLRNRWTIPGYYYWITGALGTFVSEGNLFDYMTNSPYGNKMHLTGTNYATMPAYSAYTKRDLTSLVDGAALAQTRPLLFETDGSQNIGTATGQRPNNIYMYGSLYSAAGSTEISSAGNYSFLNRTKLFSPVSGVLHLTDNSYLDFDRISLGGVTSAYPSIKRNGTGIDFRLADNSNFTFISTDGIKGGRTNVLVSTTAKDFLYVSVPNTNGIGGHVVYTVFGTDGTDVQEISGDCKFAAVAKGTTVTATLADVQSPAALTGGSTLTSVLAANVTTNNVFALGVTATTSLTTTNLVIKWRVETPSTFTVNAIP